METVINGNTYRTGKLNAFKQFHVSRRLAPIIFAMGTTVSSLLKKKEIADMPDMDAIMALGPAAEAISKMTDADADYVLNTCLSVCARQQGDKWAPVCIAGSGMMFEDITLPVMMRLTVAVIQEELGNFFPEPQPKGQAKH